MNPREYENLANVENHHWFYVGKRQIVRHWIQRIHPLRPENLLVDCGAGTGRFVAQMKGDCRVLAVDDHEESLAIARTHLDESQIQRGSCINLPLEACSVDVLTALDVLEHVGNDDRALIEFGRVTRPGGIVVITVPALMSLWSDWDVSLHHYRRYTKRKLLALVPDSTFEVVHCGYINVLVLPLVWIIRKFRAIKGRLGRSARSRSEDAIPPRWINECLRVAFVGLACQSFVRFPAGVGLLAVLKRKETPS